jgi:hypothetical protein
LDASSTRADVDGKGAVGANKPTVTPSADATVVSAQSIKTTRVFTALPPLRR